MLSERLVGSTNATLYGGIDIICSTCYIKGIATAQLNINGNFSEAFDNVRNEFVEGFSNITSAVVDYAKDAFSNVTDDIFSISDYRFPPLDANLDIEVPAIPDTELIFQFDKMELYMEIDTIIYAGMTYIINIYSSKTEIGFKVGEILVGVVFTVDLILDVTGAIDISSGFHIQLNDGVEVKIPIFGEEVHDIT